MSQNLLEQVNRGDLMDAEDNWRPEVLQKVTERAWVLLKEELRIEAERRRLTPQGRTHRRGGR